MKVEQKQCSSAEYKFGTEGLQNTEILQKNQSFDSLSLSFSNKLDLLEHYRNVRFAYIFVNILCVIFENALSGQKQRIQKNAVFIEHTVFEDTRSIDYQRV